MGFQFSRLKFFWLNWSKNYSELLQIWSRFSLMLQMWSSPIKRSFLKIKIENWCLNDVKLFSRCRRSDRTIKFECRKLIGFRSKTMLWCSKTSKVYLHPVAIAQIFLVSMSKGFFLDKVMLTCRFSNFFLKISIWQL